MATFFELVLWGEKEAYLEGVGREALEEIERWEAMLSFFRPTSDIGEINRCAAYEPTTVDPRVFRLLERAQQLSAATGGAFDITVAPLLRCWGFAGGSGQMPTEEEVAVARERVGGHHLHLNADDFTVSYDREGVLVDLGAIGKGFAIEQAAELLRDYEIPSALIHGGTSTIYALGAPPDAEAWTVAIQKPQGAEGEYLAQAVLRDRALSVSAPHGKWFESEGRKYGHVIDPRTGYPTNRNLLAALITESATESDALSTALLTRGVDWIPELLRLLPGSSALVAFEDDTGEMRLAAEGPDWRF